MREIGIHLNGEVVTAIPGVDETVNPRQSSTPGRVPVYNMGGLVLFGKPVGNVPGSVRALVVHNQDLQTGDLQTEYLSGETFEVLPFVVGGKYGKNGRRHRRMAERRRPFRFL